MTTPWCTSRDHKVCHYFANSRPPPTCPLILITLCFLVQFSVRENLMVVTGNPETKDLKDLLPDILKQVGPQQYNFLKTVLGDIGGVKEASSK